MEALRLLTWCGQYDIQLYLIIKSFHVHIRKDLILYLIKKNFLIYFHNKVRH